MVSAAPQTHRVQVRLGQGAPIAEPSVWALLLRDEAQPPHPEAPEQTQRLLRRDLKLEGEATPCASGQLQGLQEGVKFGSASQQTLEVSQPRVALDTGTQQPDFLFLVAGPSNHATRVVVVERQALLVDLLSELPADTPEDVQLDIHLVCATVPQQVTDHVQEHLCPDGCRQVQQRPSRRAIAPNTAARLQHALLEERPRARGLRWRRGCHGAPGTWCGLLPPRMQGRARIAPAGRPPTT
mmetsp:Transcript_83225/g.216793  ORF Transcript_83225/g.216793 Transcript_83225/m.216793 type:complete len:240 (-) Transcript_83225:40-759(-)